MSSEISPELKTFIAQHIRSVGHLEALLLMAAQHQSEWSAMSLSSELRTNPSYAQDQLDDLQKTRIIVRNVERNSYSISAEVDPRLLDQLDHLYKMKRTTVINLIYNQPMERIRGFADAFLIKKE